MSDLDRLCDGKHQHLPWGLTETQDGANIFATARERNYPDLFCRRIAALLAKTYAVSPPSGVDPYHKIGGGVQPRREAPAIVCDWVQKVCFHEVTVAELKFLQVLKLGKSAKFREFQMPNGGKVLNSVAVGVHGLRTVQVGVSWATGGFVASARIAKHPLDAVPVSPPEVAEVIFKMATGGPSSVRLHRTETLRHYIDLEKQLRVSEAELHASLHPDVEKVVANKRILLFEAMLKDIKFDDLPVVNLLKEGIKLTGELDDLEFWQKDFTKML